MEEAIPLFILFGVMIVAAVLMLIGLLSRRSRHEWPVGTDAPSGALPIAEPKPEGIRLYVEADGAVSVEFEGRRFKRLSDIGNEQLRQRASAVVAGIQRFAEGTPAALPGGSSKASEELRAWRSPADGALVVEFRGQCYRRLTDIRDGETGHKLLALIGELGQFIQDVSLPAGSLVPTGKPDNLTESEFLKQLAAAPASAPVRPPTFMGALDRRPSSSPLSVPMGLAGQIDKILQEQLADNEALEGRSVRVVTAPDGSLMIEVGGRSLHWPDEVTDSDVREAIQKAIRTWERSSSF